MGEVDALLYEGLWQAELSPIEPLLDPMGSERQQDGMEPYLVAGNGPNIHGTHYHGRSPRREPSEIPFSFQETHFTELGLERNQIIRID